MSKNDILLVSVTGEITFQISQSFLHYYTQCTFFRFVRQVTPTSGSKLSSKKKFHPCGIQQKVRSLVQEISSFLAKSVDAIPGRLEKLVANKGTHIEF